VLSPSALDSESTGRRVPAQLGYVRLMHEDQLVMLAAPGLPQVRVLPAPCLQPGGGLSRGRSAH